LQTALIQAELDRARQDAAAANSARAKLSEDLEESSLNHRLASLTQEYAAFKKHSTELLAKVRSNRF
jgi:hypothetical protein